MGTAERAEIRQAVALQALALYCTLESKGGFTMQPLEILQEARNAKLYLLEAEERLQEAESIAEGTRATR